METAPPRLRPGRRWHNAFWSSAWIEPLELWWRTPEADGSQAPVLYHEIRHSRMTFDELGRLTGIFLHASPWHSSAAHDLRTYRTGAGVSGARESDLDPPPLAPL